MFIAQRLHIFGSSQQIKHLFFIEFLQNNKMEKMSWKQVRQSNRNNNVPNARWGHSCCVIEDQVIFFGGYADSNYMNDVWTFNTITMEWNEVETTGDIPSPRSNCSMNFDKQNNRIIVFGGGGPNKVRYNTINILDWKTKEWKEIFPKENQPAPWERTYHTAELFSHYLITFGGEGISDLEDLWIYDFTGMKWTEVLVSKSAIRPCARRFHSSALVNNEFFVIAGCYGKYRCLSDIYSIDLTSFLENGKVDNLQWKDRKMKDYTFLTRWGHTSAVYENKICVFGGRFCNDLNDILIVDPCKDQINLLKVSGQLPKPRRRHSACFLGSSMLVFGGFNGEYYNDLHYISIKLPKKKLSIDDNITNESVRALRRLKAVQWQLIETKNGDKYQICVGLLIPRFKSIYSFDRFLRQIDGKYYKQQLQDLLLSLNRGYGKIDLSLAIQYEITIFETKQQLNLSFKNTIMEEQTQILSVAKRFKGIQPVILLDQERYSTYLQQKRCQQCYFDITLNINNQAYFRANKALLAVNSQYFANMFSHHYSQNQQIVKMLVNDVVLFETFLNYLTTNFIVASATATHTFWIGMLELADYYSVDSLMKICENQLLSYVSQYSCQELLIFALKMSLSDLASACSQQIVKRMVGLNRDHDEQLILQKQNEFIYLQRQKVLKKVYNNQRFDILQKRITTEEKEQISSLKKKQKDSSQNYQEQKQNNQIKN